MDRNLEDGDSCSGLEERMVGDVDVAEMLLFAILAGEYLGPKGCSAAQKKFRFWSNNE